MLFLVSAEKTTECIIAPSEEDKAKLTANIEEQIEAKNALFDGMDRLLSSFIRSLAYRKKVDCWQDENGIWQASAPVANPGIAMVTATQFQQETADTTAKQLAKLMEDHPELLTPRNKDSVLRSVIDHLSPRKNFTPMRSPRNRKDSSPRGKRR